MYKSGGNNFYKITQFRLDVLQPFTWDFDFLSRCWGFDQDCDGVDYAYNYYADDVTSNSSVDALYKTIWCTLEFDGANLTPNFNACQ